MKVEGQRHDKRDLAVACRAVAIGRRPGGGRHRRRGRERAPSLSVPGDPGAGTGRVAPDPDRGVRVLAGAGACREGAVRVGEGGAELLLHLGELQLQ